jgi:hypothetical protein
MSISSSPALTHVDADIGVDVGLLETPDAIFI